VQKEGASNSIRALATGSFITHEKERNSRNRSNVSLDHSKWMFWNAASCLGALGCCKYRIISSSWSGARLYRPCYVPVELETAV
jgi:hypothetical protein